jgi:hypothetical protein
MDIALGRRDQKTSVDQVANERREVLERTLIGDAIRTGDLDRDLLDTPAFLQAAPQQDANAIE